MTTVAYLGPEYTNTHFAALKKFGRRAKLRHAPTVDDVFRLVECGEADNGVVPVENSLEGAVTHTLDRFSSFRQSPVHIHGEIELVIKHHLVLWKTTNLVDVQVVYSHPQALAQCHHWLAQQLPRAMLWETNSTAEAVGYLSRKSEGGGFDLSVRAAIARPELANKDNRLRAMPITDLRENKTRFLILGLGQAKAGRHNKTSILFAVKDKPGALHDGLVAFKRNKINMTKIESRPSKRKAWEYLFFIDIEGHELEPRVGRALKALKRSTSLLRILGSYPVR